MEREPRTDEQLVEWLASTLQRYGKVPDDDMRRFARQAGITRGELRRARELLKPSIKPAGYVWSLTADQLKARLESIPY